MSADLSDISDLAATLSLKGSPQHHRSGSSPPVSSNVSSVVPSPTSEHTAESEEHDYDLDLTSPHDLKNGTLDKRSGRRSIDASERRTVFIPNLPRDATAREVNLMFAFAEGFIKVQLYDQQPKGTTNGVTQNGEGRTQTQTQQGESPSLSPQHTNHGCFILFDTPHSAIQARERLNGMVFDPTVNPPVVLQARIAMKNLFLSKEDEMKREKTSRRNSGFMAHHAGVIPPSELLNAFATPGHTAANTPPFHAYPHHTHPHSGYGSPSLTSYGGISPTNIPGMTIGGGYYHIESHPTSPQHNAAALVHPQYHTQNPYLNLHANGVVGAPHHQQSPYGVGVNGVVNQQQQQHFMKNYGGHANGHSNGYGSNHGNHSHGHHNNYGVGPHNAPINTLFLARLDAVTNEELHSLLTNSFPMMRDYKFMVDSKNQRIAFVEFTDVEAASSALARINGYNGIACAYSKNELNNNVKAKVQQNINTVNSN